MSVDCLKYWMIRDTMFMSLDAVLRRTLATRCAGTLWRLRRRNLPPGRGTGQNRLEASGTGIVQQFCFVKGAADIEKFQNAFRRMLGAGYIEELQ